MIYHFKFDVLPPNANAYLRAHWAQRANVVQQWGWLAIHAAEEANFPRGVEWATECHVTWLLYVNRLRDWDNAAAMWKAVGDGMRHALILKDDNPKVVKSFMVSQQQVGKAEQRCEVVLDVIRAAPVPALKLGGETVLSASVSGAVELYFLEQLK